TIDHPKHAKSYYAQLESERVADRNGAPGADGLEQPHREERVHHRAASHGVDPGPHRLAGAVRVAAAEARGAREGVRPARQGPAGRADGARGLTGQCGTRGPAPAELRCSWE